MTTRVKKGLNLTPRNYVPAVPEDPVSHLEAIDAVLGNTGGDVFIGELVATADDAVPSGTIWCDGSAVSRTTYSELFDVIGTIYGVGDGSTTFNLPDYRGWFLRGFGNGPSTDPDAGSRTDRGDGTTGSAVGTQQLHALIWHSHGMSRSTNNTTGGGGNIVPYGNGGTNHSLGWNGGNETRPDNKYVLFSIRYQ